ncbi:hypothetical protein AK830_g11466 [Neonectria ditissima]|uniref:Hydantoin utilization protein A n=1 Tax=Neonectria ditissima TaxID=78410 RepID=A0A0P7AME0_9HYPO|nr:hypothetical protein AK830_g11466 [Neonectria ditissima]
MSLYRIGVDVGGTNTDAAILDIRGFDSPGRGVLASHKASTTQDITSGIEAAIRAVLDASRVDQARVLSVTIGTTHFINALVEADARRLDRVAVVRLCGPFTRQIPPFSDFPVGLRGILDGGAHYLDGGHEIDGREIAPLDPEQMARAARDIVAAGIGAVALVGVFSPLDHEGAHEEACKKILLKAAPELQVVCSHDIGPTGLLERENATILNAAILRTGHRVKRGFKRAMARLRLSCPLYLSQNDGTLIDADTAAEYPIKTFASGPTNSMTGAAFLAGIDHQKPPPPPPPPGSEGSEGSDHGDSVQPQVLVVDIGGTTTDVCALLPSGFPRQAPGFVELGGVRTAFSMPEVVSIGLGGGSIVRVGGKAGGGAVAVGPGSVGHFIQQQAKVFGGDSLTATDIVVAMGRGELGNAELVRDVPRAVVESAGAEIKRMLESVIEQMKVSSAPVHVLLVGGGAMLVTEDLHGVAKCIRPIHQGAANAVGAAIAKVSGEIDIVEIPHGRSEKTVIDAACKKAIDLAVQKGAARDDVQIVEVNKMPLQYMHNGAIRIQIRAVGRLSIPDELSPPPSPALGEADDGPDEDEGEKTSIPDALKPTTKPSLHIDLEAYRPDVRDGTWYVSEVDLELFSTGCGVLGTGGGGPTHHEYLKGLQVLRSSPKDKMRIISPRALKDDDIVCFGSWYGSPSVINERIAGGNEIATGIEAVNKVLGIKSFQGMFTDEIGGGNGMSAFPTGVHFDVPVIDGDAMGRAYPTMYHATFSVYGHSLVPCVLSDARGNSSVVMNTDSPVRLESILRTTAIELGLGCAVCANPLPGSAVKSHGVPNTLSLAWYLGRAVHLARRKKISYVDAIFDVCAGKLLFTGKIVDVRRHIGGGYTMGAVVIAPLNDEDREPANTSKQPVPSDRHMVIPFQNEYLYAALSDAVGTEETQEVVCTVPDLISILGQDGEAIGSQDLRYGLRVNVVALPAHPLWKTERGMKIGGPEGFGLKMPFVGVSNSFAESRSVIDEFGV